MGSHLKMDISHRNILNKFLNILKIMRQVWLQWTGFAAVGNSCKKIEAIQCNLKKVVELVYDMKCFELSGGFKGSSMIDQTEVPHDSGETEDS